MDERLEALLRHFTRRSFKEPPRGVGLKTMVIARDEGLIELRLDENPRRGRLTVKGSLVRKAL